MKILIITLYYHPEPLKIFSDLAEGLCAYGHEVIVLTTFPNHPEGKTYSGYRNCWPKRDIVNGIKVIRVPFFPSHNYSAVKRSLSYLSFMLSTFVFGFWLVPKPDIIYTVQPPSSALTAWLLSKIWRVPFIYEILDMWPETLIDTNMLTNRWALGFIDRFCNWIYRHSSALRVISKGQLKNLLAKGVPMSKLFYIPVWVDVDFYSPMERDAEFAEEIGATGYFNIVYTGNLGIAQGMDVVLSAANELQYMKKIQFILFGDGAEGLLLRNRAEELGIKNIKLMGSCPASIMNKVYSVADCLLLHLRDKPAFRIAVPHKLLSYMASGKPVIAAIAGDGAELVRTANAGMVCKPDDSAELVKTIKLFLGKTRSEQCFFGHNGRIVAVSNFEMKYLVEKIDKMLVQVISKPELRK